ncbi:MAG: hypothetical protein PF636_01175 [Actinomycetota bacterium]|nr:hypothetical protein [Actinomycetota bacterium]
MGYALASVQDGPELSTHEVRQAQADHGQVSLRWGSDMALGTVTQEMKYDKSPIETLADLERALKAVGKVKSVDQARFSVRGSTKYGLATVKIEVRVDGLQDGSVISFTAKGGDIGGVGAKDGLKRLMQAITDVENPVIDVASKTGLGKRQWVMFLLTAVGITVFGVMLIVNAQWVSDNWVIFGTMIAAIIWYWTVAIRKS